MEDQKLLWIVFSVVLFVVVVLASVLYLLKPKASEPVLAVSPATQGAEFDTYEYVRGASPALPLRSGAKGSGDLQIVVGEESAASAAATTEGSSPPSVGKAQGAASGEPKRVGPEPSADAAPAVRAPAPRTEAPKSASRAASQPGRIYWIQTASFKSRSSAESMVATLGEKGITGRVQVSDVGGQAYYRVRVGPYTSRDEAEKFLSWIKGVKGLEQSYVSAVSRPLD